MLHIHFPSIDSTQSFAKHYLACLRPGFSTETWFLFTADYQSAGKGTKNRVWLAPPDSSILATFAFCLPKHQKNLLPLISPVAALALSRVLETYDLSPSIKWVNDLQLDGQKVAGILCESFSVKVFPQAYIVLVGLGINVNLSRDDCADIDQPATALNLVLGRRLAREPLLAALVLALQEHIGRLMAAGFTPLHADFKQRLRPIDWPKMAAEIPS